jgi:GTPase involved in cell partitioning and DNA repair
LQFYSTSSSLSATTEYLYIVGLSSKKLQLPKNISKKLRKELNTKVNLLKKEIIIIFEKRYKNSKKGLKKASKSQRKNLRKAMFGSNWTPQGMS